MGAPVSCDAEISEAKQIMAEFILKFGKNYAKLYTIGLLKQKQKELAKQAKGNPWKLMKCERNPEAPVRKTGHLLKRSKYLKKWNDRFFVVNGNWIVDYHLEESKYNNGDKPRGTINMTGYSVVRDLNNTLMKRLEDLAAKVKLDISALPKPEEFPEFTMEIYHERKECVLLQATNAEEFKAWADIFEDCRYYGSRFNISDDKIHRQVFPWALWRTRWEVGMWGGWWSGGGEVAMISDAISDQIAWVVMCKVDDKMHATPWPVRSKSRNMFTKTVDSAVTSAVGPAWTACYDGVKKARPEISEKLTGLVTPISEGQTEIKGKITGMVTDAAKGTLDEKVTPNLTPLVEQVFSPVTGAMSMILVAFEKCVANSKEKYTPTEGNHYIVSHHSYCSEFWDADRKLSDLFEPLWLMRKVFDDVSPWGILHKVRRRLRKLLNNALFTFETFLARDGMAWDVALAQVKDLLKADCITAVLKILGGILCGVVQPLWDKLVIRPAQKIVAPLADSIPEAIKDFLDIDDMLEDVLNGILMACCLMVLSGVTDKIQL